MMYPRLFVARQLLQDDGLIFISIDDHEVHNLRLIMNEIFGEESFLACFIWHRRQMADSRNKDRASTDHEYVLSYRKPNAVLRGEDIDVNKYSNPDNDPRGSWFSADLTGLATKEQRPNLHYDVTNPKTGIVYHPSTNRGWSCNKERFMKLIQEDRILWPSKPDGRPRIKKFLDEVTNYQTGFSSMLEVGFTTEGTKEIQELFNEKIIQFPKPVSLIKTLVKQAATDDTDIVVDFFAGSCTTAQSILELNREDTKNRRFIMVQLPEPIDNGTYATIADIGKERIRRVIAKMKKEKVGKFDLKNGNGVEDLAFKVFKLAESNYKPWTGPEKRDPDAYASQMAMYTDPFVPGWKPENVIWEVAIKEGYGLNSEIIHMTGIEENNVYHVTDPDKRQSFRICLDEVLKPIAIRALALGKNDLFICRDKAMTDDLVANLALQCRMKTI